jgi:putative ABC transport system permease protein
MFGYYFELALRSLRRNVVLTTLMVTVMGFGIGASMTVFTTLRAMGGDPIPDKSGMLFVPQIDAWGPQSHRSTASGWQTGVGRGDLFDQLTYRDAMALMQAHRAELQTAMHGVSLNVTQPGGLPFPVDGRAAYTDFFRMFEVPFRSGGPWSRTDDEARSNVVVVSARVADRFFPHTDAVGKVLSVDNRDYRIVGVIAAWTPVPRYYDLTQGPESGFSNTEDVFLPFSTAIDRQMGVSGSIRCHSAPASGWEGLVNSDCVWIQFWAELPNAAAVRDYRRFLYDYAADQRRLGRFHWAPHVELHDLPEWLAIEIAVPNTLRVSTVVAFGFLAVCLINAVGLMLARFSGRAGELGVRRAMGASRRDIFLQCLAETAIVGLPGGLLGLALTGAGLAGQRALHNVAGSTVAVAHLTSLDWGMVLITLALAVGATVSAGLYPVWRASRAQPGWQLKTQ